MYFFHLNCKHLFGCKANRTFILLSRFGLIMSTPKRRGVGRRCGFGEAARVRPAPGSQPGSIDCTWRARRASSHHQLRSLRGRHPEGARGLQAALGAPGEPQLLGDGRGCFLCPNCLDKKRKSALRRGRLSFYPIDAQRVGGDLVVLQSSCP